MSDPSRPQKVGGYTSGYVQTMGLSGNHLFLAADSALQVIDVSEPANPRQVGSYTAAGWIRGLIGLVVSGDYLYVNRGLGLDVLDILDPAHPKRVAGDESIGGGI